jgi:hypothetical protein
LSKSNASNLADEFKDDPKNDESMKRKVRELGYLNKENIISKEVIKVVETN